MLLWAFSWLRKDSRHLCVLLLLVYLCPPLVGKVPCKLNTAELLSDPVPDFFSTPAANSSHTDEGRSAKHLLCSALPSSGISCAAFPPSAAPSWNRHTAECRQGHSCLPKQTHIQRWISFLSLCLSVSRSLTLVWFYHFCYFFSSNLKHIPSRV